MTKAADPANILIADDNPDSHRVLGGILSQRGYRIHQAENGREVLESAQDVFPDLIILGVRMPEIDGLEACRRLKASETLKDIPVLFLGALTDTEGKVEALRCGGVDYITTPFQTEEVLARVETHLALRRLRRELEDRARERTAELAQTARGLKHEVAERQRLVAILEKTSDFVGTTRPDGRMLYLNQAGRKLLGLSPDEDISARKISDNHPDWATRIIETEGIPAAIQTAVWEGETAVRRPTGQDIPVSQVIMAHKSSDGRLQYLSTIIRDISERKEAEEKLQQERDFTNRLIENSPAFFVVIDSEGKTAMMNRSMLSALGYSLSEILDTDYVATFIPERERKMIRELFNQHLLEGKTTINESHILTKDGQELLVEWRGCPLPAPDGGTGSFFGVGIDITERKAAVEKLLRSEDRYRSLVENLNDIVYRIEFDPARHFTYVSPSVTPVTGFTPEEHYADPDLAERVIHPWDRHLIEDMEREDNPHPIVLRWIRKDGTVIWTEHRLTRILDDNGRLLAIEGVARDITARKKAVDTIRQERDTAQTYLDIAGVMFVALDSEGLVTLINKLGCKILGYEEEEIIGKNWFATFLPESLREQVGGTFRRLMAGEIEAVEHYENPVLTKEGTERLIAWHNTLIKNPAGRIVGTLSSGEDITERKKAEQELQEAFAEIRRLNEQINAENIYLREEIRMSHSHGDIVGRSSVMRAVLAQAEQVADTDSTVLILGETGTGKELLARAIHNMSLRKDKPLVIVNCASIPAGLVESELFGREKGAFTGALTKMVGRFEAANGGTIFLDEIGELSIDLQAKLLRVLQEGQFERLGSSTTITVDVRLLAATNRDLEKLVDEGSFRKDLLYRLNVFPITIPPLRDRSEDIEPLVWTFASEFATRMGRPVETITQASMNALRKYRWPGNVRELRNVVERAMIGTTGPTLRLTPPKRAVEPDVGRKSLSDVERNHILNVLREIGWRVRGKGGAAEILDLNPSTLESRMKKLGITRPK